MDSSPEPCLIGVVRIRKMCNLFIETGVHDPPFEMDLLQWIGLKGEQNAN